MEEQRCQNMSYHHRNAERFVMLHRKQSQLAAKTLDPRLLSNISKQSRAICLLPESQAVAPFRKHHRACLKSPDHQRCSFSSIALHMKEKLKCAQRKYPYVVRSAVRVVMGNTGKQALH
jgi:hypothetical protein